MSGSRLEVATRILLAVGGGYFASSSAMAMFCLLLVSSGVPRMDAVTLGIMLVFVLYLCLGLWVFAASALWRPVAVFSLLITAGYGVTSLMGHGG
ncbi:hypothetical protein S101447_02544 [Acetobacter ascendens]|uniref:Iron uptake protein n=1 Tax=Acetobacter ascendens TaxID=481146 RepID=A0A1Y0V0B4_9PROT|nr:hypothetical protein S101447_02544 [Acetobacter ascendens]